MEDQYLPEYSENELENAEKKSAPNKLWLIILIGVLIIASIVVGIILLAKSDSGTTSHIRDIFIIFMALESIVIGAVLVILVVQISTLINLIQNEVKPILKSTSETVDTLKGTTQFLSENLVSPVIKLNSYLAGMKRLFDLFKLTKK
jgi:hypothetical protein